MCSQRFCITWTATFVTIVLTLFSIVTINEMQESDVQTACPGIRDYLLIMMIMRFVLYTSGIFGSHGVAEWLQRHTSVTEDVCFDLFLL